MAQKLVNNANDFREKRLLSKAGHSGNSLAGPNLD